MLLTGNELKVFWALCGLLQEKGSIYIWTSCQHLSKITNLSIMTTQRALKKLFLAGLIHRSTKYYKKDEKFQAKSIYRVLRVELG